MSDLGKTTTPVEKPVENAEKIDALRKDEGIAARQEEDAEAPPSSDDKGKGKGKGKAVETPAEDDEGEDSEDDSDDDEDDDDEDDVLDMDEVDPADIIAPTPRRSARTGQIDYSSEEALKKAGLAPQSQDGENVALEEDDEDFKADDTMEDD